MEGQWQLHKNSEELRGIRAVINTPFAYPIGSMYAIYGNIYHQYTPNVSTYTIHGSVMGKASVLFNSCWEDPPDRPVFCVEGWKTINSDIDKNIDPKLLKGLLLKNGTPMDSSMIWIQYNSVGSKITTAQCVFCVFWRPNYHRDPHGIWHPT